MTSTAIGYVCPDEDRATLTAVCKALSVSPDHLKLCVEAILDDFHTRFPDLPGIGMEELRLALKPLLSVQVFRSLLFELYTRGVVTCDRMWVRRPGLQAELDEEDEDFCTTICAHLTTRPYRPPRVRDIAHAEHLDEDHVRRLLRVLSLRGDVEEIAHDHFFLQSAVQTMARFAIELAAQDPSSQFTAASFRDRFDNGRKVAIQILEFFDRHGFTILEHEKRRINPEWKMLFHPEVVRL